MTTEQTIIQKLDEIKELAPSLGLAKEQYVQLNILYIKEFLLGINNHAQMVDMSNEFSRKINTVCIAATLLPAILAARLQHDAAYVYWMDADNEEMRVRYAVEAMRQAETFIIESGWQPRK